MGATSQDNAMTVTRTRQNVGGSEVFVFFWTNHRQVPRIVTLTFGIPIETPCWSPATDTSGVRDLGLTGYLTNPHASNG